MARIKPKSRILEVGVLLCQHPERVLPGQQLQPPRESLGTGTYIGRACMHHRICRHLSASVGIRYIKM